MTGMKKGIAVALVGAGNLAWHLGIRLKEARHSVTQVVGRTPEKTKLLAKKLECPWTTNLKELNPDVSIIVLCVNDRAIETVVGRLSPGNALVVHTAGAVPMEVFGGKCSRYGVLYPLQSFSRERNPDFHDLPFCIEANTPGDLSFLESLVRSLSARPVKISSEQRALLHLAAVFANNFANYMFVAAFDILRKANVRQDILHPIMRETLEKAISIGPEKSQTGPAIRDEENIIKKHSELLSFSPEYRDLYHSVTHAINMHPWL